MDIFGILSIFKRQNLSCWNLNLLYLDYFVTFSFDFGLNAHLKLNFKSGGSETVEGRVKVIILRDISDLERCCKLSLSLYLFCIISQHFSFCNFPKQVC